MKNPAPKILFLGGCLITILGSISLSLVVILLTIVALTSVEPDTPDTEDQTYTETESPGLTSYDLGDEAVYGNLKVAALEFRYPYPPEVYESYEENTTQVVVLLRVLNDGGSIESFSTDNLRLVDDSGMQYIASYDIKSEYEFDGYEIFPESYSEGLVGFNIESLTGQFSLKYGEYAIYTEEPDYISIDLGSLPEEDASWNLDYSYGYTDGITASSSADGKLKYTSDILDLSFEVTSSTYVEAYLDGNCIWVDSNLYIGREPGPPLTGSSYENCFTKSFYGVDRIEKAPFKADINGQEYEVELQKLISENEGLTPEGSTATEDYTANAFFHITLRGDISNTTSENYLGIEYYSSWDYWLTEKEGVLELLEGLEIED